MVLTRFDQLLSSCCNNIIGGTPINVRGVKDKIIERLDKFDWFNEWIPWPAIQSYLFSS